jgi:hypothetical protein
MSLARKRPTAKEEIPFGNFDSKEDGENKLKVLNVSRFPA